MARETIASLKAQLDTLRTTLGVVNNELAACRTQLAAQTMAAPSPAPVGPTPTKRFAVAVTKDRRAFAVVSQMRSKLAAKYGACAVQKVHGRNVLVADEGRVRVLAMVYDDRVEFVQ